VKFYETEDKLFEEGVFYGALHNIDDNIRYFLFENKYINSFVVYELIRDKNNIYKFVEFKKVQCKQMEI